MYGSQLPRHILPHHRACQQDDGKANPRENRDLDRSRPAYDTQARNKIRQHVGEHDGTTVAIGAALTIVCVAARSETVGNDHHS
jgi:hypothetical protein